MTSILQLHWPDKGIHDAAGQTAGRGLRHPRPTQLALPAIVAEVPSPYQARVNRPTVEMCY
ncbi:hypothetical protein [Aeromonas salmonicida]|uniref:hypothetical protein n=1 Tax=Aeromonas salmonicida TaxID=645 RepID=UPI003D21D4BE